MSKRHAIVSIGTNSTRLVIADMAPDNPRVELMRSIGTRIGEGLGERGRLGDEPMQRTLDAVTQLARAARGHYVRFFAVATSALRRAENADEFSSRVAEELGVSPRVLTGDEEAAASYRGALIAFGNLRGERVGVIDVGGGSTEYAVGDSLQPESVVSCEIGAVRLTEKFPELAGNGGAVSSDTIAKARETAREALQPLMERGKVERVALVGGSATTSASIVRGKRTPINSFPVTRANLEHTLERLVKMPLEERKKVVGMKPQRADILPAGITVLDTALELLEQTQAIATTADLLLGILLQERDADGGQPQPNERLANPRAHRKSR